MNHIFEIIPMPKEYFLVDFATLMLVNKAFRHANMMLMFIHYRQFTFYKIFDLISICLQYWPIIVK